MFLVEQDLRTFLAGRAWNMWGVRDCSRNDKRVCLLKGGPLSRGERRRMYRVTIASLPFYRLNSVPNQSLSLGLTVDFDVSSSPATSVSPQPKGGS